MCTVYTENTVTLAPAEWTGAIVVDDATNIHNKMQSKTADFALGAAIWRTGRILGYYSDTDTHNRPTAAPRLLKWSVYVCDKVYTVPLNWEYGM